MARSLSDARGRERRAIGLLGSAFGLFWLLALASAQDPGQSAPPAPFGFLPADLAGAAGRRLATFTTAWLGRVAGLALALSVVVVFVRVLLPQRALGPRVLTGLAFFVLLFPPLSALAGSDYGWGGRYGADVAGALAGAFGTIGAWIVVTALGGAAVLVTTDWRAPGRFTRGTFGLAALLWGGCARLGRVLSAIPRTFAGRARSSGAPTIHADRPGAEPPPAALAPLTAAGDAARGPVAPIANGPSIDDPARERREPAARDRTPKRSARREKGSRKRPSDAYEVPPGDLLEEPEPSVAGMKEEELLQLSETLRRTLEEFAIGGRVSAVHPGPIITRYDFEPAPGVRVTQIVSREDDIALALRTDRIRIIPRVPGKAAVGIEIPNERSALIHFRDVLVSHAFEASPGILTLALGKDTEGRPFADTLETMPHLLVAGTTGSGKSVAINTIIASLLFRHRPEDVRLILIDPKVLELTGYDGIPHLALPVVTEPKEASKALGWLVREMERRYRILAGRGVRNVQGYHARFVPDGKPIQSEEDEEPADRMPYIVCVVDELADLMMTYASEVETPIARLAQMARAVGIHLVLATQRPSVDVITGVIKANFPARIAFQVASRTDSRTILDQNGAESLIGRGDMLYLPAGRPAPIRLHGAFLSDGDIESLVRYLRGFAPVDAPIELDEPAQSTGGVDSELDPLFPEAARTVVLQGQASTSLLQRRLKIGYARAGRLMDQLEQSGIVSGFEGSKARDVLIDMQGLEEQGIV